MLQFKKILQMRKLFFSVLDLTFKMLDNLTTENNAVFGGKNTAGFLKCVTKLVELTKYETGTGNLYHKLALAIDMLSKVSIFYVLPAGLVFSISMPSILKQLGTTLITTAFPSGRDKIYAALLHYQDSELNAEPVNLKDLLFTTYAFWNEMSDKANETIVLRLDKRFPTNVRIKFFN